MSKNQLWRTFVDDKKLNLVADSDRPAWAGVSGRDKIESNLQSQMYVERTPGLEESRAWRGPNLWKQGRSSTVKTHFFQEFFGRLIDRQKGTDFNLRKSM
jgi:hypothetical protein